MPGITIVYSAVAGSGVTSSVPTLGTVATIGLSMLAAAAGTWSLRGRSTGQRMLAVGVCAGALTAAISSGLGASAWANARDYFSNAAGGTLIYDSGVNAADTWTGLGTTPSNPTLCGQTSGALNNGTGSTLRIDSVQANPGTNLDTTDADYTLAYTGLSAAQCKAGVTQLAPGQACQVIAYTGGC